MKLKPSPATHADSVLLPIESLHELQAFHAELLEIAQTLDISPTGGNESFEPSKSRYRALATVLHLWADRLEKSINTTQLV